MFGSTVTLESLEPLFKTEGPEVELNILNLINTLTQEWTKISQSFFLTRALHWSSTLNALDWARVWNLGCLWVTSLTNVPGWYLCIRNHLLLDPSLE